MPSSRQVQLRRLLAARETGQAGIVESAAALELADDAPTPKSADLLHRVDAALAAAPADEILDPAAYRRALEILLRHAEPAIDALGADHNASLGRNGLNAVEAVIRADGSRPSLLLRNHTAPHDHPLAGQWSEQFVAQKTVIAHAARATGRIQPAGGSASAFFGTGVLVKADGEALVLTNMHVLEAMLRRSSTLSVLKSDGNYRIVEGVEIDFLGETQASEEHLFDVVEARPTPLDGEEFARLDAAVLVIKPKDASPDLPEPVDIIADADAAKGAINSHILIGFPGRPEFTSGEHDGVDWGWVNQQLFGARYGLKRIAPGIVHRPLGKVEGDTRRWVFGHDATSLGGNSGSLCHAWLNVGAGGFGLHFAGRNVDSNFAHAISAVQAQLRSLGVPVKQVNA